MLVACLAPVRPGPALAVLDINDRGPVLNAGAFALRVTNIGVVGNAFFDKGLSFDPSFEFPRGSGHEALHHAELWVGGRSDNGPPRVSGGPMLEWRPSLDPDDRVRVGWAGRPGTKRGFDDDGDGRTDEELFNGRDDDGDGEVDEDMGFSAQQVLAAEYRDDRIESVNYGYSSGEHHVPLGLSVHQEAYAWSLPGYDRVAGLQFTITNTTRATLRDLWLGLYCDFDSRGRDEAGGHLNDRVDMRSYSRAIFEGTSAFGPFVKQCFTNLAGTVPVLSDGSPISTMPAAAVVGLSHTTDPLSFISNFAFPGARAAHEAARAPRRDTTFRYTVFAHNQPPGQGGPPVLDGDRYLALQGEMPGTPRTDGGDYGVLVSCGPFVKLEPGQSVEFAVALVAAPMADSLSTTMENAAFLYRGTRANLLEDGVMGSSLDGMTGINGHEVCYEPPVGLTFNYDPHCPEKFVRDPAYQPLPGFPPGISSEAIYTHGTCIWSDFDCDACTGLDGAETVYHWLNPGTVPPQPSYRTTAGDHVAHITWDNQPEIVLDAGLVAAEGFRFSGYRLYRLSDWRRDAILPPPTSWQLIAAYGPDTTNRQIPLESIRDTTLDYDFILYGKKHYPVGRYQVTDTQVLDGFDYLYIVTTMAERRTVLGGNVRIERIESPLVASIDSVIVPHTATRAPGGVWVVPNPYRAHAPWDRPPVPGDPFGRHLDFCGLPPAVNTIRIYTVAGDFVAQLVHDGRQGDGQVPWDLISRNGQDVESGIYLFTVESSLGHQVGRFVVIR